MVWGLSWWPMRELHAAGLHPLWATAFVFLLAVGLISLRQPGAWKEFGAHPRLWIIVAAAGTTNAAFNWGVTEGDVVRVVLLFYLMPLWAVLLARWLLHEPLTRAALLRSGLAMAGAAVVMWPPPGQSLGAGFQPIDLLGLLGGFSFALNNIMLRRETARSDGARGLAMFLGGCLVSLALVGVLGVPGLPPAAPGWMGLALALALCFLMSNLALQYGASRLPAGVTAVVMLTEVLWASGSAVATGAGTLSPALLLGGGLILAAALLAALQR
ncbi:DMT family transporter [Ideonella sp. TBM-1]|uniref:DMT family transporter n=2 Tax=Ideonella livida TaxID=2707176 RepID=A0A7C9PG08_9BURK|nr:DMT family transporter [Ideonella livida]